MNSMDIIYFNEPEIKKKIIKSLHQYLDNDIHGNCLKTKIDNGINSFMKFYSNLNINKDKLKDCIYNYISESYFQGLIRRDNNDNTIDIKEIEQSLINCETYSYHQYGIFNIHYVYYRFLFNELNDAIKNNYEILNEKISDTNSITDNKTKILIDNYHILEKSIMDINSNINRNINANLNVKLKKFDDNYRLMIKINVILFITVIYNLLFK
jgi:hypothetical protein